MLWRWKQQPGKQRQILNNADIDELEKKAEEEISEAVAFAEAGTLEPVEDLTRFVYSKRSIL